MEVISYIKEEIKVVKEHAVAEVEKIHFQTVFQAQNFDTAVLPIVR